MPNDLTGYAELYGNEGRWCTVLADVGTGTVDSLEALDVRPGQIRDALLARVRPRTTPRRRRMPCGRRRESATRRPGSC